MRRSAGLRRNGSRRSDDTTGMRLLDSEAQRSPVVRCNARTPLPQRALDSVDDAKSVGRGIRMSSMSAHAAMTVAAGRHAPWLRVAAAIGISIALLGLALRSAPWSDVTVALRQASPVWIGAALVIYWIEILIRTWRWRSLLRDLGPPSFRQVLASLVIGYGANNVLPAKLGELFRADFLGRRYGVARLSALGTIVVERLLDVLLVLSCAIAGVALMAGERLASGAADVQANVVHGIWATTAVVVLATLAIYLVVHHLGDWVSRVPYSWVPRAVAAVADGLRAVRQPGTIVALVLLSLLAWALNALTMYAMLVAVGVSPALHSLLLLLGVAGIAAAIPAAPANLGTLQFAFVLALSPAGHAPASAFAAASLVQLVLLGSVTLVGVVAYAASHVRPRSAG